jgi:hypothetical protein
MPILNFTGRKKISRKLLTITARKDTSPSGDHTSLLISASYEKKGKFPPDSELWLEVYRGATVERFELGTFERQTPLVDQRLESFPPEMELGLLKFRFFIVDSALRGGTILGLAERIPLSSLNQPETLKQGLLPTRKENLGERVWKLDLSGDDPALLIDERLYDDRYLYTDHVLFQSLVFPQIAEGLATWVLKEAEQEVENSKWQSFFKKELKCDPSPEERGFELNSDLDHDIRAKEDWIEQAVTVFCNKHKFRSILEAEMAD